MPYAKRKKPHYVWFFPLQAEFIHVIIFSPVNSPSGFILALEEKSNTSLAPLRSLFATLTISLVGSVRLTGINNSAPRKNSKGFSCGARGFAHMPSARLLIPMLHKIAPLTKIDIVCFAEID